MKIIPLKALCKSHACSIILFKINFKMYCLTSFSFEVLYKTNTLYIKIGFKLRSI